MAQTKPKTPIKHAMHGHSSSFSSNNGYSHRSSINNVGSFNKPEDRKFQDAQKKSKMGSLKKWFSRLNTSGTTNVAGGGEHKMSEHQAHRSIEAQMLSESRAHSATVSMLLLGAGGSGKSTVLKQMDRIHNTGKYENEEKVLCDTIVEVHKNITLDVFDLCKMYYELKQKDSSVRFKSADIESIVMRIATNHDPLHQPTLTKELAAEIIMIWDTETMRKVYEIRKKSHIMDNTPYFMSRVQLYADPGYSVTFDDYVRIRDQTTGIVNSEFRLNKGNREWIFKFTDVGGQRAERRKWLHVFAGIDVVLYVMSLSGYDQVLYEDHTTRCYDETLQLFSKTANNKLFASTDFIVFLNKSDVFEEKLKTQSFRLYKSDFPEADAHNPEPVVAWIKQEFSDRFNAKLLASEKTAQRASEKKKKQRGLHFHVTCATDTQQIQTVVQYVQIDLIRKLMSRAALL